MKTTISIKLFALALLLTPSVWPRLIQTARFDHRLHELKVFPANNMKCSACHNVSEGTAAQNKVLIPTDSFEKQTFKDSIKNICHGCHQGSTNKAAPKTCYTCHSNQDQMNTIKPLSHQSLSWKNAHSASARADSSQCLNCHNNSQCVKCHSARNPVFNSNHPRNFKYYHSIEARLRPETCTSCHNTSYCIRCHSGGKR